MIGNLLGFFVLNFIMFISIAIVLLLACGPPSQFPLTKHQLAKLSGWRKILLHLSAICGALSGLSFIAVISVALYAVGEVWLSSFYSVFG